MIIWIAAIAILIVLIYFLTQQRRHDDVWRSFRQRYRERTRVIAIDNLPEPSSEAESPLRHASAK